MLSEKNLIIRVETLKEKSSDFWSGWRKKSGFSGNWKTRKTELFFFACQNNTTTTGRATVIKKNNWSLLERSLPRCSECAATIVTGPVLPMKKFEDQKKNLFIIEEGASLVSLKQLERSKVVLQKCIVTKS